MSYKCQFLYIYFSYISVLGGLWEVNLKVRLKLVKPVDENSEYYLYLGEKFGKYNFKSKIFLIKELSENSYMNYSDNREFVSNYSESKLVFENADNSANFIPMEKDDAKKFIQSRQNSLGYYVYTFNKF